jgi:hypothetical protein
MVDRGLLAPFGERRARYYLAGVEPVELLEQVKANRAPRGAEDPFALVRDRRQLSLT